MYIKNLTRTINDLRMYIVCIKQNVTKRDYQTYWGGEHRNDILNFFVLMNYLETDLVNETASAV